MSTVKMYFPPVLYYKKRQKIIRKLLKDYFLPFLFLNVEYFLCYIHKFHTLYSTNLRVKHTVYIKIKVIAETWLSI